MPLDWPVQMPHKLKAPILFLLSGGITFLVDASVLFVLIYKMGMDPFFARILSILAAMLCGYVINRNFVFGKSGKSVRVELIHYLSVASLNAVLSYAIYAALIGLVSGVNPILATAVAVIIVAISSYAGYSRFVFIHI